METPVETTAQPLKDVVLKHGRPFAVAAQWPVTCSWRLPSRMWKNLVDVIIRSTRKSQSAEAVSSFAEKHDNTQDENIASQL